MASKPTRPKRGFGYIRKLPSKRHQASYMGPDGLRHTAAATFTSKTDAESWLAHERAEVESGQWVAPERRAPHDSEGTPADRITVEAYADQWLAHARLRETTRVLYERRLRLQILPVLGDVPMPALDRPTVAGWWYGLDHDHQRTCDIAYGVLRAMLNVAVDEGLIDENPCHIRGAGKPSRERSIEPLTPAQVRDVADAMPPHLRLAVLLGAWCGLRSGEVRELRRSNVAADGTTIVVRQAVSHVHGRALVADPKTDAGRRTVRVPAAIAPDLVLHLDEQCGPGSDDLLFHDEAGEHIPSSTLLSTYQTACERAGIPGKPRFHDLRHVGLTYAAVAGATTRELQAIAGHTTPAMAMRYQEVASTHMDEVVDRLSAMISGAAAGLS